MSAALDYIPPTEYKKVPTPIKLALPVQSGTTSTNSSSVLAALIPLSALASGVAGLTGAGFNITDYVVTAGPITLIDSPRTVKVVSESTKSAFDKIRFEQLRDKWIN